MRILGRMSAALVAAVAVSTVSVGAASATSAPDPYSVKVTTHTTVSTPDPIHTGTSIDIAVKVTANSPTRPTGKVTLTLTSAPRGAGQARFAAAGPDGWTRTIDYNGGTVHVRGPHFPKVSEWLVTAVFTPGDAQFRGSRDGTTFSVIAGPGDHNPGDNDHDDNGLLPDTGGPALLWLLLGVCLVGGGATAVAVARRRTTEPAAA